MGEALLQLDRVPTKLGHYCIGEKIGAGGMGEVFRALDEHLDREVAIKVLPLGVLDDPVARRHFHKEALALSKLNHPNIATIFDFDTHREIDFLVMEYIPGVTLSDELRKGPLPGTTVVALGMQMAAGLAAAHQHGVVHRDLNPKNLRLMPDGRLKILDFGLARLLTPMDVASERTASQSEAWTVAGTLHYMAPEQLRGEPVDVRCDLWAAGVVLYEMATGRLPFCEKVHPATADAIQHQPTPFPTDFVQDIPPRLERVILKCLEKNPQRRYQSAEELLDALQVVTQETTTVRPVVARLRRWTRRAIRSRPLRVTAYLLLVTLSTLVISLKSVQPHDGGVALPEMKHIAVLPFVAVEPDSGARAFSQGLSDALTAKLTQLTEKHSLQVVPPSEIRAQAITSVEQARTGLGVNLVLEGSFHQSGQMVRVTYDLVDARTRRVLRGDAITAGVADPFALEDRVVASAIRNLDIELTAQERHQLAKRGTSQPAAYDLYLRGRGYLLDYQKPENIESAIDAFRRALERDPQYAPAFSGLGESYWQKFALTHDSEWVQKAEAACRQANMSGLGHGCLGTVYNGTGNYEGAAAEFQRELDSDATSDSTYRGLAYAYEHMGKLEDAERTYRRAISVRPQYWAGYSWLGVFLYRQGRYSEAADLFSKVTDLAPDNVRGYSNLGGIYVFIGRYAEAEPVLRHSLSIRPTQDAYINLGTADFYLHRFADAVEAYEEAVKLDARDRVAWGDLGDAYYWIPERREESAAAYRKAVLLGEEEVRVNPKNTTVRSYLAFYYAMLREKQLASSNLARTLASGDGNAEVLLNAALTYNQLGDSSKAVAWLQKALQKGLPAAQARNHPNLDNLKSNRKLQDLLHQSKSEGE